MKGRIKEITEKNLRKIKKRNERKSEKKWRKRRRRRKQRIGSRTKNEGSMVVPRWRPDTM
jgi:hypothetical protein